jgi:hypothetical protein
MPKHRYPRFKGGKLRPTPPSPRTGDISDKETRDENRRLKEKSEHGLHPVIPPRFFIARIGRDDDLMC